MSELISYFEHKKKSCWRRNDSEEQTEKKTRKLKMYLEIYLVLKIPIPTHQQIYQKPITKAPTILL